MKEKQLGLFGVGPAELPDPINPTEPGSYPKERVHRCHWPGCPTRVLPKMWGCSRHWFRLPKVIRDRIWATYRPGQEVDREPSAEYWEAALAAQRWIKEHGGPV